MLLLRTYWINSIIWWRVQPLIFISEIFIKINIIYTINWAGHPIFGYSFPLLSCSGIIDNYFKNDKKGIVAKTTIPISNLVVSIFNNLSVLFFFCTCLLSEFNDSFNENASQFLQLKRKEKQNGSLKPRRK